MSDYQFRLKQIGAEMDALKHELDEKITSSRTALNTMAAQLGVAQDRDKVIIAIGNLLADRNRLRDAEVKLDSMDMQMICMALADEALRCPGFDYAIREIVKKLGGDPLISMFESFLQLHTDLITPRVIDRKSDG
jgi:hypothetical protein